VKLLRNELSERQYLEVDHPEKPGEFSLKQEILRIAFFEGINPHNAIGVGDNGEIISMVVAGKSNRVGATYRQMSSLIKELGAKNAIILDNGADVMMYYDDQFLCQSFAKRTRLNAIVIFEKVS